MRKDVRTGAAIGIIIIAVIVVYIIMAPKGKHSKTKTDNKVVLDTGKPTPAGETTGGGDRVNTGEATTAAHEEHPDGSTTPGHDAMGGVGGTGTAVPGHMDDIAGPVPNSDIVPSKGAKTWASLLAADAPVLSRTPEPEHGPVATSTPTGDSVSGHETHAVNHTPLTRAEDSPVPNGDVILPAPPRANADSHIATASPTPTRVSAPAVTLKSHRVAEGETFSSIARSVYGDQKYFKDIIKANPKVDPSHLKPGMTIMLPEKPQAAHEAAARSASSGDAPQTDVVEGTRHRAATAGAAAVNAATEYRVQSGDSLYKISIKLYHTPNKQDAIYQLNKDSIGADPAKLKLGAVLKLPEAPTTAH